MRTKPFRAEEPHIGARVSEELARDIHELAEATDRSVSSVVRRALKQYVYARDRERESGSIQATP